MIGKKIIICAAAVCLLGVAAFKTTTLNSTILPQNLITPTDDDIVKDGLVAWYTFNNGSLKDKSGNNNDIVFCNAKPTKDRFGNANNAYSFNGNGSYMKVSDSKSLNPKAITLMAVVKPKGFYNGPCHCNNILTKGWNDYANGFYFIRFTDQASDCNNPLEPENEIFSAGFGDNGKPPGSASSAGADSVPVSLNEWYNIIYTFDGSTSKMYINGKLISEIQKMTRSSGNNQPLFIGKHGDPEFPYWFNGIIDEIRIYNKAINEKQIKKICALAL